jgi:hypothetical protein
MLKYITKDGCSPNALPLRAEEQVAVYVQTCAGYMLALFGGELEGWSVPNGLKQKDLAILFR